MQIRHLPKQSGCADLPPCCATAENGDFTTVQVETGIYNNLLGSNHNFSAHETIYLIKIGYLLNLWVKCTGAGGQITLLKGVVSIIFIHNQKGLCSSQRLLIHIYMLHILTYCNPGCAFVPGIKSLGTGLPPCCAATEKRRFQHRPSGVRGIKSLDPFLWPVFHFQKANNVLSSSPTCGHCFSSFLPCCPKWIPSF